MMGRAGYQLVFGLSADPIHVGHVELVSQSARRLIERGFRIADVLIVPVYRRSPVGAEKEGLPDTFAHRLRMCALAAGEIRDRLESAASAADRVPSVRASAIEAELARHRERPNYTVETLRLLKIRSRPGTGLIFLISAELISGPRPQLGRWYRPEAILKLAALAVCPRPGYPVNGRFVRAMARQGGQVILLGDVVTLDISATEVRAALSAGVPPAALARRGILTPAVARFLRAHNLYAGGARAAKA
jgi:nicotinate (nicotinamide) nucleotide adenylyltransferase